MRQLRSMATLTFGLTVLGCADLPAADDEIAAGLTPNLNAPAGTGCVQELARNTANGRERRQAFALTPGTPQVITLDSVPAGDLDLSAIVTDTLAGGACTGRRIYEAQVQRIRVTPGATVSVVQRFVPLGTLQIDGTFEDSLSACSQLSNGGFETASSGPGSGTYLNAPSDVITGWQVTAGAITYLGPTWSFPEGQRGLDMNGGSAGAIAATLTTVPGRTYGIVFSLSGNPDRTTTCCGGAANSPLRKTLRVSAGSASSDYAFDVTGRDPSNLGWMDQRFTFTATGVTTTLSFQSTTESPYWGPMLDNVRVASCE